MYIEQKENRIFQPQTNTTLSAEETNQQNTELQNLITAGGLTPNAGVLTQVRDAVQNIVDTSANNLQQQIDAITAASDVFDVVGTYDELQAYDKSTVPVNDIIKVLQDSTHNNAATYYRLEEDSGGTTDWVYLGQEGPYYTKSEIDADFATKAELPGIATASQVGLIKPDGTTTQVAQDGTLTFSQSVLAALPLFTHHFVDHLLNDASYLRADTFSWHSGSVYTSAYEHLVDDMEFVETPASIRSRQTISSSPVQLTAVRSSANDTGSLYAWYDSDYDVYLYTDTETPSIGDRTYDVNGTSVGTGVIGVTAESQQISLTAETETISGTTITFYRAADGHKIVLADQESNVTAIYNATGVAWYYILDTANTQFKLPRSQWAFVGLRGNVGDYVEAGLPNITGTFDTRLNGTVTDSGYCSGLTVNNASGAFYTEKVVNTDWSIPSSSMVTNQNGHAAGRFDASRSNSIYGNSTTVQQAATQMYLYFYCGNTVIDQTTIDVGEITENLNDKADTDLSNLSAAGEEKFDGSWVNNPITIHANSETSITGNGGTLSYDISANFTSGSVYQLLLSVIATSSNTNGVLIDIRVSTDKVTEACVCGARCHNSQSAMNSGSVIIPWSSGNLTLTNRGAAGTVGYVYISAYRRVK